MVAGTISLARFCLGPLLGYSGPAAYCGHLRLSDDRAVVGWDLVGRRLSWYHPSDIVLHFGGCLSFPSRGKSRGADRGDPKRIETG